MVRVELVSFWRWLLSYGANIGASFHQKHGHYAEKVDSYTKAAASS